MSAPYAGMCCSNCVYFESTDEGHGECRRHAPQPNSALFIPKAEAIGQIKTDIHWPKVYNNNWCGQFGAHKGASGKTQMPPVKEAVTPPSKPAKGGEVLRVLPEETRPNSF
ncbi:MAG: hypothetical protein KAS23_08085 [Anaerohalosphaera sp.]|nr:hypothetical protein [Anaerohalosphaera sp.]